MLSITFYGVRGSTPTCDPGVVGYGGNTSCVLVSVPGESPIILDLGTGLRRLGVDLQSWIGDDRPLEATALVSHLHWDHIQGIPFFVPILTAGSKIHVVGPPQKKSSLEQAVAEFIRPPLFPVSLKELPGEMVFSEMEDETFFVGSAKVTAFPVAHVGATNGYRVDVESSSVAYISDHQQPSLDPFCVPNDVVEKCQGVDVLIHDAQFDSSEFAKRRDWGHCTAEFALALAVKAGARRLVLFHHDPNHDDKWVEASVKETQAKAPEGLEVLGAAEGLHLTSEVVRQPATL